MYSYHISCSSISFIIISSISVHVLISLFFILSLLAILIILLKTNFYHFYHFLIFFCFFVILKFRIHIRIVTYFSPWFRIYYIFFFLVISLLQNILFRYPFVFLANTILFRISSLSIPSLLNIEPRYLYDCNLNRLL